MLRLEEADNQFSVCDHEIKDFIRNVSLKSIPGIGKVNYKKCIDLNMSICSDMYKMSVNELTNLFGSFGFTLFNLIRGIDNREVETNKIRKSVSVEDTFKADLVDVESCENKLAILFEKLIKRCESANIGTKEVKRSSKNKV